MTRKQTEVSLFRLTAVGVGALLLTGCATKEPMSLEPRDDPALNAMKEAVAHIEEQHRLVVQVERGRDEPRAQAHKPDAPEFNEPIYLRHWQGEVAPALSLVADLMGYGFVESGDKPAIAPTVSLDYDGESAFTVLSHISDQSKDVYAVRVNMPEQRIELVYQ